VQRGFLCDQLSNQHFGTVNREFVTYRAQYPAVAFNRLVDIDTLVAHDPSRPLFQAGANCATRHDITGTELFGFNGLKHCGGFLRNSIGKRVPFDSDLCPRVFYGRVSRVSRKYFAGECPESESF
jgi:hypothetical protein